MKNPFRWFLPKRRYDVYISCELWSNLASIKPGVVKTLSDNEGTELAVMNLDDLEHIARLAGLRVGASKQGPQRDSHG